jgi:hypothetical protein
LWRPLLEGGQQAKSHPLVERGMGRNWTCTVGVRPEGLAPTLVRPNRVRSGQTENRQNRSPFQERGETRMQLFDRHSAASGKGQNALARQKRWNGCVNLDRRAESVDDERR